jgi:hypothetical protein
MQPGPDNSSYSRYRKLRKLDEQLTECGSFNRAFTARPFDETRILDSMRSKAMIQVKLFDLVVRFPRRAVIRCSD